MCHIFKEAVEFLFVFVYTYVEWSHVKFFHPSEFYVIGKVLQDFGKLEGEGRN